MVKIIPSNIRPSVDINWLRHGCDLHFTDFNPISPAERLMKRSMRRVLSVSAQRGTYCNEKWLTQSVHGVVS